MDHEGIAYFIRVAAGRIVPSALIVTLAVLGLGIPSATTNAAPSQQALPSNVDLQPLMPPVGQQGDQFSCVAWAVAYYYKSFQENRARNWGYTADHLFSPSYIYNQLATSNTGGLSSLEQAFSIVVNEGVAPLSLFPYNDQDWTTKPSAETRREASKYKAKQMIQFPTGISGLSAIKSHLANEMDPVVVAFPVYLEGFDIELGEFEWHPDLSTKVPTIIDIPSASRLLARIRGLHAVTIVGYDDDRRLIKFVNSWGSNWGEQGYGYFTYDFFIEFVSDAWVMSPGLAEMTPGLAEGSFVRGSTPRNWTMYIVHDGQLHELAGWDTFLALGGAPDQSNVQVLPDDQLKSIPVGDTYSWPGDGLFVREQAGNVWAIENGAKRLVPDDATRLSWGGPTNLADVGLISDYLLSRIPLGDPIPAGSRPGDQNTMFCSPVIEGELVQGSDAAVYLGQGGQYVLIRDLPTLQRLQQDGRQITHLRADCVWMKRSDQSIESANEPSQPVSSARTFVVSQSTGTVYMIENGQSHYVPDMDTFVSLGGRLPYSEFFGNDAAVFAKYPQGDPAQSVRPGAGPVSRRPDTGSATGGGGTNSNPNLTSNGGGQQTSSNDSTSSDGGQRKPSTNNTTQTSTTATSRPRTSTDVGSNTTSTTGGGSTTSGGVGPAPCLTMTVMLSGQARTSIEVPVGTTVTVVAETNLPAAGPANPIKIYDIFGYKTVAECSSGKTCTGIVSSGQARSAIYDASIGDSSSSQPCYSYAHKNFTVTWK